MAKNQGKPRTVRISVSFPDPALPDAIMIAAKAEAGPGEQPNVSQWMRDAFRAKLKRQGIRIPS